MKWYQLTVLRLVNNWEYLGYELDPRVAQMWCIYLLKNQAFIDLFDGSTLASIRCTYPSISTRFVENKVQTLKFHPHRETKYDLSNVYMVVYIIYAYFPGQG